MFSMVFMMFCAFGFLIRSFEIKTGVSGYLAVGRLTWSPSVDRPVDRWAPDLSTDGYFILAYFDFQLSVGGCAGDRSTGRSTDLLLIGRPAGRPMCGFPVHVCFLRYFDMLI
jgi:hypothetical protein